MPAFARDCDPTLGAVIDAMMFDSPPRVRCRLSMDGWVGEWWTPEPGEVIQVQPGEVLEWENETGLHRTAP